MNILNIISLLIIISSILVFITIIYKNKKRKRNLVEKQEDIDKSSKEINSKSTNFDDRYASDSKQLNENIKHTELNIKSLNQAIEKENKENYMKNVFLTNISNEIRNPLNGIMGFAALLRTDLAKLGHDDLYEFANSISGSGESLLKLLSDIIDISRIEVNDMKFDIESYSLKSIIQKSVEEYKNAANDKGIQLIIDDNLNYYALTDLEVIQRIINSVIDNAIKFTDKGYIKLSLEKNSDNKNINIIVKDTGIGIATSYIPSVFEPYRQESLGYTSKYQGVGLSLPLAKKALTIMENDIQIESEKGVGTTVTIILKLTDKRNIKKAPKLTSDNKKHAEQKIPWLRKNIFLVEDDKINQILFTKLLVGCNKLTIAGSGEDALEKLNDLDNNNSNYDFVLMDINLPGQYDGISLMHKMKQDWKEYNNIPFIAQTAYAMSAERGKLLAKGFDEYLSKPIKKSDLISVIEIVLRK